MAGLAHVPVAVLHQATDPDRFRPGGDGPSHALLYVANHRPDRPIVDWLLPTGHDLAVYGRRWLENGLDPRFLRGDHIENDDLYRYYGSAAIVLNDSWADMRRAGSSRTGSTTRWPAARSSCRMRSTGSTPSSTGPSSPTMTARTFGRP